MKSWQTSCIPNNKKYVRICTALAVLVLAVALCVAVGVLGRFGW